MYGMTNSGKVFSDELTNSLIYEAGFNQYKYKISIYCKYAPDGFKLVVLSYVDGCVYLYTSEEPGKRFLDTLRNRFHVNFLVYANWFMFIWISQLKDHYIPVILARYDTPVV